jgi:hypothetical protein
MPNLDLARLCFPNLDSSRNLLPEKPFATNSFCNLITCSFGTLCCAHIVCVGYLCVCQASRDVIGMLLVRCCGCCEVVATFLWHIVTFVVTLLWRRCACSGRHKHRAFLHRWPSNVRFSFLSSPSCPSKIYPNVGPPSMDYHGTQAMPPWKLTSVDFTSLLFVSSGGEED